MAHPVISTAKYQEVVLLFMIMEKTAILIIASNNIKLLATGLTLTPQTAQARRILQGASPGMERG